MKKRNIVIYGLVLLMLIATFAACAATRTQESTGEYVDDSVITTKVKSLLAKMISSSHSRSVSKLSRALFN